MNEGKTLVHMAISAMIGALIISAAVGLITLGYNIWSMFSRQDLASRRLRDYSTYAAFDNALIRGQDAVALIASTEGDPFVVVRLYDASADVDNKYHNPPIIYCNSITETMILTTADNWYDTGNAITTGLFKELTGGETADKAPLVPESGSGKRSFSDSVDTVSYESLQKDFVGRPSYLVNITNDDGTISTETKTGYAMYHSVLIYDSGSSTDIIGILLVEQPPELVK